MSERLTNKKEADLQRLKYEKRLKQGYPRNIFEERFLKLAHFENLQEQGLLVELPCNTGRFVYILDNMQINRCLTENTLITKGIMARVLGTDKDICYVVYKEDIGKTVFLTKTEAQAALERIMSKKIIDVACGSRMFWFDKNNPNVIFCDKRKEKHILCDGRSLEISPDVQCDFTDLPFANESFYLAVFDPPHLNKLSENSWLYKKYGKLYDNWPLMIKSGFDECMRVLKSNGILIFKWSEIQIKTSDVISVLEQQPLFGHKSGKQQNTHWLCFMKS